MDESVELDSDDDDIDQISGNLTLTLTITLTLTLNPTLTSCTGGKGGKGAYRVSMDIARCKGGKEVIPNPKP